MKLLVEMLFPAIKQNDETINKKVSKVFIVGFLLLFLVFLPLFSFLVQDAPIYSKSVLYVALSIFMLFACFSTSILTMIWDAIFFKHQLSLVQVARALSPFSLIFIYLRFAIELLPVYFESPCFFILNIWYVANIFVSSKKALNYTNAQAIVVPVIWMLFIGFINFSI